MPRLASIHVAPATRLPMRSVERATVEAGQGIVGDRYHGTRHRHVTVQSAAALRTAAAVFGSEVPAELTRRNLTIDEGVVPTAPGSRIRIGDVLLEVVRVAAPCKLLDDTGHGAAWLVLLLVAGYRMPRRNLYTLMKSAIPIAKLLHRPGALCPTRNPPCTCALPAYRGLKRPRHG